MTRLPSSTYRLQFRASFSFDDAVGVLEYLSSLGISHVYSSPYLQAAPGSTHGYDVADFDKVNLELGGAEGLERFATRLSELELGQILDIVPNHMALARNNPYWHDVLENGRRSRYADYFDIDWESGELRMRNKVLLPILGDQYGLVLKSGLIQLAYRAPHFEVLCGEEHLPISVGSISTILVPAAKIARSEKLGFLADAFDRLADREADNYEAVQKLYRDQRVLYSDLDQCLREDPAAAAAIQSSIAEINANIDTLDTLLQKQNYRLALWRTADQDLSYRRFFDVNSLIGVRVEDGRVFLSTHDLVLRWLRSGALDGVRVDHCDGLQNPQQYFERLRQEAPEAWIVAEKILARNETLPEEWPIAGTTGYEFANMVNGLLLSPQGLAKLDTLYNEIIGRATSYAAMVHDKKINVTQESLGSDVNRLTAIFLEICESDRDHRDYTRSEIRHAIQEISAALPVYRTYVVPDHPVRTFDAAVIATTISSAVRQRPDLDRRLFDFIADVLLLRRQGSLESTFLLHFQQFTSAVMAKGFEDTVLYCYNRLTGLNEVGSNPEKPLYTVDEFHKRNLQSQRRRYGTMVSLSTHDTKRSEDVRARLAVLSELPAIFRETVLSWFSMNEGAHSAGMPDANTEYLYYQTLIGAWPITADRAKAYMQKATREAKEQTSWTQPNKAFEDALNRFIDNTFDSPHFLRSLRSFVDRLQHAGRINSLTQTLLKYTVPGVPDLYQGSELWDHRLVDPDNRTPVDFALRNKLLSELDSLSPAQILKRMEEGLPKLWTIRQALRVRRDYPACFGPRGHYKRLLATGTKSDHIIGFLRGSKVLSCVPRLTDGIQSPQDWETTTIELPKGKWRNVLSAQSYRGGPASVAEIFSTFPVALLVKET
ncbi:malto-oligosyltrehalose synthase [Granulicella sp. 5B5]|uniref:malto-oligosyltrehalose synthase n=1 Tax=Granulicella sp. 5B5 TaxID=1617967 RepID=UPI0015F5A25E|nr:malto-oligosyltrehalose synthase [Granulicella sp. 5B5]QMV17871.1 malto-oligosyltrehalose synthase [Granulicella sp. 5B5]